MACPNRPHLEEVPTRATKIRSSTLSFFSFLRLSFLVISWGKNMTAFLVLWSGRMAVSEEWVIASLWRLNNRLRVAGSGRGSHKGCGMRIVEHAIADIGWGGQTAQ